MSESVVSPLSAKIGLKIGSTKSCKAKVGNRIFVQTYMGIMINLPSPRSSNAYRLNLVLTFSSCAAHSHSCPLNL